MLKAAGLYDASLIARVPTEAVIGALMWAQWYADRNPANSSMTETLSEEDYAAIGKDFRAPFIAMLTAASVGTLVREALADALVVPAMTAGPYPVAGTGVLT